MECGWIGTVLSRSLLSPLLRLGLPPRSPLLFLLRSNSFFDPAESPRSRKSWPGWLIDEFLDRGDLGPSAICLGRP